MRCAAVLLLALAAVRAPAATSYVSDELILGVFSEASGQGQRLATLHSGTAVETLSVEGEYSQVRLNDGTTGWVKSSFLTAKEPAVVRIKKLEEDLDRMRATPSGQSEAAARNELEQLHQTLETQQQELDAARARLAASGGTASAPARVEVVTAGSGGWLTGVLLLLAGGLGFWLGYATLARRLRTRFGGIKVY